MTAPCCAMMPTVRTGRTPAGRPFAVPDTADMFVTLVSPARWGPAEFVCLVTLAGGGASLALRAVLPVWFYVAVFVFWRAAYNLGIGLLLHFQSHYQSITRWLQDAPPANRALLKWAVTGSMGSDYQWKKCPVQFNAWLSFRALSMLILSNDGWSYVVLSMVCFKPLAASSFLELAFCFSLGSALIALSIWSKSAAHDCVGDFAWYWGDFFFTMDGELIFDGVFELFPHPMYTVGYAAYYGLSLISRSYTLLFVSLLAHVAQILFLMVVEEPHIQRIYGPPEGVVEAVSTASTISAVAIVSDDVVSADDMSDWAPSDCGSSRGRRAGSRSGNALLAAKSQTAADFVDADQLRFAGNFALAAVLLTTLVVIGFCKPSKAVLVALLIVWRIVHWGGLGFILKRQSVSKDEWASRFSSPALAYANWQQVWRMSYVMNHFMFLFVACALPETAYPTWSSAFSMTSGCHIVASVALISIAAVSIWSAWAALGEFGFYYGNFFVSVPQQEPSYNGVYRYANNPECVLGYLAYYGLAIWQCSWPVFILAVLCQGAHAAFIVLVEAPHMHRTYQNVRGKAALERTVHQQAVRVAEAVPVIGKVGDELKQTARRSRNVIRDRASKQARTVRETILTKKEQLAADIDKLNSRLREHELYLRAVEIRDGAHSKITSFDGQGILAMLEQRGMTIERVSDFEDDEVSQSGSGSNDH